MAFTRLELAPKDAPVGVSVVPLARGEDEDETTLLDESKAIPCGAWYSVPDGSMFDMLVSCRSEMFVVSGGIVKVSTFVVTNTEAQAGLWE